MNKDQLHEIAEQIKANLDIVEYICKTEHEPVKPGDTTSMQCPFHLEKDPSFKVSHSKQLATCFGACNESWDIVGYYAKKNRVSPHEAIMELAKEAGIPVPENGGQPITDKKGLATVPDLLVPSNSEISTQEQKETTTSRSYENMAEYIVDKSRPEHIIGMIEFWTKAGCKDDVVNGIPVIVFPCADGIDRLRFLNAHPDPKFRPRSSMPDGSKVKAQWFGLNSSVQKCIGEHTEPYLNGQNVLVLCNGQPSVLVAQYYGVPAFCKTDGENDIPEHLLPELCKHLDDGFQLYIALDADEKGQMVSEKTMRLLQKYHPRQIEFVGGKGYDLADHCKKYGDLSWDELQKLIVYRLPNVTGETVKLLSETATSLRGISHLKDNQPKAEKMIADIRAELDRLEEYKQAPKQSISGLAVIKSIGEKLNETKNGQRFIPIIGFRTGLDDLDWACGGFERGNAHVFMGETSHGKSILMSSIAIRLISQANGAIFSPECIVTDYAYRMIAAASGIPANVLKHGGYLDCTDPNHKREVVLKPADWQLVTNAWEHLRKHGSNWEFIGGGSRPIEVIDSWVKQQVADRDIQWVILDSLDKISLVTSDENYKRTFAVADLFEKLASKYNLAVFATIQGGRNTKGRADKRLGVHDPVGGHRTEENTSFMAAIFNPQMLAKQHALDEEDIEKYPKDAIYLHLLKTRGNGAVGSDIELRYVGGAGVYNYPKAKGNENGNRS